MAKVKVYHFRAYEITTDRILRSKRPATLEAIGELGPMFHPILDTEEEIDSSLLGAEGFQKKPTPAD
jgi:hypothetical protein